MQRHPFPRMKAAFLGLTLCAVSSSMAAAQGLETTVSTWKNKLDARIGVILSDTSSDWELATHADERFPMASTFKSLLCGAVLARVDAGQLSLDETVTFGAEDLLSWSPVTEKRVESGMSVGELCEAAITMSDNAAANLMLERVDGPAGLTAFLRDIGDPTTRLDRTEPGLNESAPGEPRDTTSPRAITSSLSKLLFGDVLQTTSAARLKQWMIDDQVADKLIRSKLPEGWVIGDKTGSGGNGTRGIVAFLETPDADTYLAAIYMTETAASYEQRNEAIADIGRAMIEEIMAR